MSYADNCRTREARSREVTGIMNGVSFSRARTALPVYCFELMQNLSEEEQTVFGNQLKELDSSQNMTDAVKSLALGLMLLNVVGSAVLSAAVEALGSEIK